MNAQELFLKDGSSAKVWYCSECRMVKKTEDEAERCCKKHDCRICGEPVDSPNWMVHRECKRSETIDRAQKMEAWDGWVYCEGLGNDFFESMDALMQEAFDSDAELPEYVFICKPIQFKAPDIEDIIAQCLSDHYEDAYDAINSKSYTILSRALSEFEKANSHIVSYEPVLTKMVKVPNAA